MKYTTEQLPWQDFAVLGLDREQVLSLPKSTIDALLSGNRTSLIRFENPQVPGLLPKSFPFDAKLSLKKDQNGELRLLAHPINPELKNNFELSRSELKYLESGKMIFIPKLVTGEDGKLEEALIAYDQTTNELVAFKREGLKAPNDIHGMKLTPQQQKDFVLGKSISVNGNNYQMDPNNEIPIVKKPSEPVPERSRANSKYRSPELIMDIMLLTTGLGHYVLLWHLAKMLLHSNLPEFNLGKSLQNRPFRNALADAQKEIVQKQQELARQGVDKDTKTPKSLSMDELIGIIEKKAGEHIVIDKIEPGIKEAEGGEHVSVIQKKDGPSGGLSIRDEEPRTRSFKI